MAKSTSNRTVFDARVRAQLSARAAGAALALGLVAAPLSARAADPTTTDCLAASEKSIALRSHAQLRAARGELLICAADSCPADIRTECARRVDEVNSAIPTVVFEAKDAAGRDVSAVRVSMDGQPLVDRLQGTSISADPGEHTFRFEAPGRAPTDVTLVLAQGVKERREVARLDDEAGTPGRATLAPAPPASEERTEPWLAPSTQRVLGWTGIGAGALGVTLGIVFAAKRSSKMSDLDDLCRSGEPCPAGSRRRSDELADEATTAGTMGAVSFIAGAALAGSGVALLLTTPSESSSRVSVKPLLSPSFAGVSVQRALW